MYITRSFCYWSLRRGAALPVARSSPAKPLSSFLGLTAEPRDEVPFDFRSLAANIKDGEAVRARTIPPE